MTSARAVAWGVLQRVSRDRAFADLTLHAALRESDLPRRDRAFATELAYGALRLRGRLDAALRQVLDRDLDALEPRLRDLLRLGAYQILNMDGVRDAAAVSESVALAREAGLERAAGLVNAVLRALARAVEQKELRFPELDQDPVAHVAQWGSLPEWLASRWVSELGPAEAAALAEACTRPPPRTVRVAASADLRALARRLGGRPGRYAPRALTGLERDPVHDPGFARGELAIQDEASQLVPLLLGVQEGEHVVDCCAAPGTKAVQLAEQVGPKGEVIAMDVHPRRLGLIRREAARLGLANLRILERDATKGFDLRGQLRFRRILVDAPCSGLGALRRNPDARWHLDPAEIERGADRAVALLGSVARYVEEEGVLVYSVCTFTPEETDGVLARFLAAHPDFRLDDPRPVLPPGAHELVDAAGVLRTLPHRHGCDGFVAARLVRVGGQARLR